LFVDKTTSHLINQHHLINQAANSVSSSDKLWTYCLYIHILYIRLWFSPVWLRASLICTFIFFVFAQSRTQTAAN